MATITRRYWRGIGTQGVSGAREACRPCCAGQRVHVVFTMVNGKIVASRDQDG